MKISLYALQLNKTHFSVIKKNKKGREICVLKREKVSYKTGISKEQPFLKSDLITIDSKINDKSA